MNQCNIEKTQFLSDKIESKMLNYVQSSQCHLLFVDGRDKKEEIEKDLTDFILSSEPVATALDTASHHDYPAIFCPDVTSSSKDQQLSQLNFESSDVNVQTTLISGCESSPINNNVMQNNEDSKPSTSSKANTFLTREAQAIYKVLKGTSSLLESYDNEKSEIKQQPSSIVSSDFLKMQTQTLKQISVLQEDFEKWERLFMLENNMCFPSVDNIKNDEKIIDVHCRIKIGEKLLQSWNISFQYEKEFRIYCF